MAMTKCNECSGSISSEAMMCPHCGIAAPSLTPIQKKQLAQGSALARSRAFAGVLFFGGLAWPAILAVSGAGGSAVASAFDIAKWFIGIGFIWYIAAEIERNLIIRKIEKLPKN